MLRGKTEEEEGRGGEGAKKPMATVDTLKDGRI
jgi:hypothetical protein